MAGLPTPPGPVCTRASPGLQPKYCEAKHSEAERSEAKSSEAFAKGDKPGHDA